MTGRARPGSATLAEAAAEAPVRSLAPSLATIAGLLAALYALPLVFNLPLIDPDEGLHAAISIDMVERDDYVVPRLLGTPFLDKPIAFFFAQAVSLRMFGAGEFAVRLPGQLFGLLGAITTGLVAGVLAGRRVALMAGCVYATLAFPMILNQAAVHDVALVPWTNLAWLCFLRAMGRRGLLASTLGWCAFAGVWLGLAMLTKGLAGVALVGLPVAVLALWRRELWWGLAIGGAASLIVGAIIAAPWYLALERAEPGYLRYFFVQRHLLGFATTTQLHGQRPWFYYLPVLLAGSAPWVCTLPLVVRSSAAMAPALAALRRAAATWLVADVAFLSVAGSKLATYVLPVFPAMAALIAVGWAATPTADGGRPSRPAVNWILAQAYVVAALLPVAMSWAAGPLRLGFGAGTWMTCGVMTTALLIAAWQVRRQSMRWNFVAATAGVVLTLVAAYATVFPTVAVAHSARDLAAYVNRRGTLPGRLLIVDERVGSFLFYLTPELRRQVQQGMVEGVPLGRALVHGATVSDTLIALPADVATRLAARLDLAAVPVEPAGRYRVYDADALRNARPR